MDLRLKLDDTDFETLATNARAMIPPFAPEWTDHNIHDPGIMLLELMAWVAEAQIYGLSRMRNAEKAAYARLLGVEQAGPRAAHGLVWPLEANEPGYLEGAIVGQSIPQWAAVKSNRPDAPPYRLVAAQHLTPARLVRVVAYFADGRAADYTGINRRNGATYLPFGVSPTSNDRLELVFEGTAILPGGSGAFVLGVEAETARSGRLDGMSDLPGIDVWMRDTSGTRPVAIERDTTVGLMQSGVVALGITDNEQAHGDPGFTLILKPRAAGFLRAPRVRRIAANALDVEQVEEVVEEESYFGRQLPGQVYKLLRAGGLRDSALKIEIGGEPWTPTDDLAESQPCDRHYQFDETTGQVLFGNGINGLMPPQDAPLTVVYNVCGGTLGNAQAGVGWSLRGVTGTFGRNSQPCNGGTDRMLASDMQAEARRSLNMRITYVIPTDLEQAALSLIGLDVTRALELAPLACHPVGTRTLLVAGWFDPTLGVAAAPERAPWLRAVRSRLASGLPAGQRLVVIPPRYVSIRIVAELAVHAAAHPAAIISKAEMMLAEKFFNTSSGISIWKFGREITPLLVAGWLRKLDHVLSVSKVTLYRDGAAQPDMLELSATELPLFTTGNGDITVVRAAAGGAT
ncbi:hypothetical protein OIU34_07405 [Pararhizobium sp. BT-229]|uniref:hypothetical protein n=1 Tax=Pararhizobium sp. BT-229 TaxID=2986923 RepID=UPI0021F7EE15|nr:hypothetical protein [Pararhizobium sp. BT-229]MCV9961727.1 hypothetical protein [Pararhizobium sp. BT-229]